MNDLCLSIWAYSLHLPLNTYALGSLGVTKHVDLSTCLVVGMLKARRVLSWSLWPEKSAAVAAVAAAAAARKVRAT